MEKTHLRLCNPKKRLPSNSLPNKIEHQAVSPSTLNRVITGKSGISPDMALRLSKALGRSAESWLAMQDHYDLWQAKKHAKLDHVQHIEFATAESDIDLALPLS
jgi:addiction module HigA family antidote